MFGVSGRNKDGGANSETLRKLTLPTSKSDLNSDADDYPQDTNSPDKGPIDSLLVLQRCYLKPRLLVSGFPFRGVWG